MKIDIATASSVLVELSKDDMQQLNVTFEARDANEVRGALSKILAEIQRRTGRRMHAKHMEVDVIPGRDGGCLMILSACAAPKTAEVRCACALSAEPDVLLDLAKSMRKTEAPLPDSDLFLFRGAYLLLLYDLTPQQVRLVSEFAPVKSLQSAALARIVEGGQLLLRQNALIILSGTRTQL